MIPKPGSSTQGPRQHSPTSRKNKKSSSTGKSTKSKKNGINPTKKYRTTLEDFTPDLPEAVIPEEVILAKGCIKRVEDMCQMGWKIVPFFLADDRKRNLASGGGNFVDEGVFDVEKFYKALIMDYDSLEGMDYTLDEDGALESIKPISLNADNHFDGLLSQMTLRQTQKRSLYTVPLILGKGFEIGVSGYSMIIEQKRPQHTYYDPSTRTGDEVVAKLSYVDKDTAEDLAREELRSCFIIGGDGKGKDEASKKKTETRIIFTPDEIRSIRSLDLPPGIKLLGFKDMSECRLEDNIGSATFLYPAESLYTGSTKTFTALLKTMTRRNLFAIALSLPRRNASIRFSALIPQAEELDDDGQQIDPPGLVMVPLPFADDVREIDDVLEDTKTVHRPDEEEQPEIELATKIMERLKVRFDPANFPNPSLNHFYECLAAKALDQPLPEVVDNTIPDYEAIGQRVGKYIRQYHQTLRTNKTMDEPSEVKASTKTTSKAAAPKIDAGELASLSTKIEKAYQDGKESKLTVNDLKEFAKAKGASNLSKLKKPDLLELCKGYVGGVGGGSGGGDDGAGGSGSDNKPKSKRQRTKK